MNGALKRLKHLRIYFFLLIGLCSLTAQAALDRTQDQALIKMSLLYGMTEQDVEQFDAEVLNPNFELFSSAAYQRLLAARSLIEAEHHQISDEYGEDVADALLEKVKADWEVVLDEASEKWGRAQSQQLASLFNQTVGQFEIAQAQLTVPLILASQQARARNINGQGFKKGTWALTYDDGPVPKRTTRILNLLKQHGYTATFFVLARNAKAYPKTVREIIASGMEVANHSYNHPNMAKLNRSSLDYQINTSSNVIEGITGRKLRYFRLPYGSGQSSSTIMNMLGSRGLTHVSWNVDSLDWRERNSQRVYERTVRQMQGQGGGVILFHDIHEQTVRASELLMSSMKSGRISGRLMTVSQAL